MQSEWIELRTCRWVHEAQFLKSVLESAGIEAMVPDEHTLGAQPFYAPMLGWVRVLVRSADLERAREILDSAAPPVPGSPETDSEH